MLVRLVPTVAAILVLGVSAAALPQKSEDITVRGLVDEREFVGARPTSNQPASKRKPSGYKKVAVAKRPVAKIATPATTPAAPASVEMVGLTFWRLRQASGSKAVTTRILTHDPAESDKDVEWIAERVAAGSAFSPGQRVRMAIEVPTTGYLYVVSREQYKDGSVGEPYLIFPTTRLRSGENAVSAGLVLEIPSLDDKPAYLTLRPSRPDQVAELVTVIVTPEPLAEIKVADRAQKLDDDTFKDWEAKWSGDTEHLELVGGEGQAYTPSEKAAGSGAKLTQDDPAPQSVFRVQAKEGQPFMATVPMRFQ